MYIRHKHNIATDEVTLTDPNGNTIDVPAERLTGHMVQLANPPYTAMYKASEIDMDNLQLLVDDAESGTGQFAGLTRRPFGAR